MYKNLDFKQSIEVDLQTLSADLTAFIRIWENMFVQDRLPSWTNVNLLDFPTSIIPMLTVVDIDWDHSGSVDGDAMTYRFWGTGHVNAKNVERTGLKLSENSDRLSHILQQKAAPVVWDIGANLCDVPVLRRGFRPSSTPARRRSHAHPASPPHVRARRGAAPVPSPAGARMPGHSVAEARRAPARPRPSPPRSGSRWSDAGRPRT